MTLLKEMLPKMIRYRMARAGLVRPGTPLNLTFSVTNKCQSRCKTCHIWNLYRKDPEKLKDELTIEEIDKIFRSMGHIYIFNISGGEPFLRSDFIEIIKLACRYLKPGIIHIPTNGLLPELVEEKTREILQVIATANPRIRLTVKPSLDHIGKKHDKIRGVQGNFKKVMILFKRLQILKKEYSNLYPELGTVISAWNVNDIEEIAAFITDLGADSYRNEIAEERSEMFNIEYGITPTPEQYQKAIAYFVQQLKSNMRNRSYFHRLTNAFRLVYYDLAIRISREKKQIIPCYAGISNAHLNPYGDIWACCTLGYQKSLGRLQDYNYDFQALWQSQKAEEVRSYIYERNCYCPLANQAYSNILLHWPSLMKVIKNIY